jgi:hypothetical protein
MQNLFWYFHTTDLCSAITRDKLPMQPHWWIQNH